jgi:L-threonate 2-dehydrogenase
MAIDTQHGPKSQQSVGVIGIGAMGWGIASSLARAGYPVTVRDIDPAKEVAARQAGMSVSGTAASLAQACQTVFVVVVDSSQIEQVFMGADGLLGGLGRGHRVLICSTIAPEEMVHWGNAVAERGAGFIDAPISGGPARALAATMSMMLAGDDAVLAGLEPLLAVISGKRFRISGRVGDATRAKLVNNLLAGVHLVAAAEAFALADRFGLDAQQMLALIGASSGQSWMLEDRVPRALSGDLAPRAAAPVITKDLRLAAEAAQRVGVDTPMARIAQQAMQATCDAGWQKHDDAAVVNRLLGQTPR